MRKYVKPYLGRALIGAKEADNLAKILKKQALFRYNETNTFSLDVEERLKSLLGVQYCILVANCTLGLKAALLSLSPSPGDDVVIPALSFVATANACLSAGLIPKMVDVDESGHISPERLEEYFKKHRKPCAVIAVHLDGSSADILRIRDICYAFEVALIEDTAQSFSVMRDGLLLGTVGDIGCFSFQENKILSSGEGGTVVTNNQNLYERVCALADHGAFRDRTGMPSWEKDLGFGENFKVTELVACVLDAQLDRIENIQEVLKSRYAKILRFLPDLGVKARLDEDVPISVWLEDLNLISHLERLGVSLYSWAHMFLPEHPVIKEKRSPYKNSFPWNLDPFPQNTIFPLAKKIAMERHCLPIYLKDEDFVQTIDRILKLSKIL